MARNLSENYPRASNDPPLSLHLAPDPPPNIGAVSNDPDEVDLSTHPSANRTPNPAKHPSTTNEPPVEADIRAMLRAGAPQSDTDQDPANPNEDPLMKMLSQMMGGKPSEAEAVNGELPPGLATMLGSGGMAGNDGASTEQTEDTYDYVWRVVHAILALCLAAYATTTTVAYGEKIEGSNDMAALREAHGKEGINLFLVFATAQLVLQSSRFIMERRKPSGRPAGWLGLIGGFLPEPYRGYVILAEGYAKIWAAIVDDAMIIVFVVGCVAWWKGLAG